MRSDEARVAEAITSLTTRLETWGIHDATTKAHDYINDMLRAGWRPRAREVWQPPATKHGTKTDPKPWADQARATIRAATKAPGREDDA